MGFMKDRNRNRLDAEHQMRLALSGVEPRFKKFVEAKSRYVIKVLLFVFCFFSPFCNYLVESQLFLQIRFLNKLGSQKKMVVGHYGSRPKCGSPRFYEWVADTSRALTTLVNFNS